MDHSALEIKIFALWNSEEKAKKNVEMKQLTILAGNISICCEVAFWYFSPCHVSMQQEAFRGFMDLLCSFCKSGSLF